MKEKDDQQPIGGIVQLDDAYWGGERRGGKRGRGTAGKTPFVAAVELNEESHPVRMKLSVVKLFKSKVIAQWSAVHIRHQTIVISLRLACFRAISSEDKHHYRAVTGGHLDMLEHPAFKWVNTIIGNVKIRYGAVVVAHRLARLIWILLTRQEHYRVMTSHVSA